MNREQMDLLVFLMGKTPQDLDRVGVFGMVAHCFRLGYNGMKEAPRYVEKTSLGYVAHYVGYHEYLKRKKEEGS